MIEPARGDILEAQAEALVNPVNCVGVMSKGLAAQFRRRYPANFKFYEAACECGQVRPGRMLVFETKLLPSPRYIVNFPTKRHFVDGSRIDDIEAGLPALVREVMYYGMRSIAVPALGCGLGRLDWTEVRPRIVQAFAALPAVRVLLYEGP